MSPSTDPSPADSQPLSTHSSKPPIPDPEQLKPAGLNDRQKRWIFLGVAGVISCILLANIIGSNAPVNPKPLDRTAKAVPQNPSQAQIREWESNLKATENQLREEMSRRQQAEQLQKQGTLSIDDLQRASALAEAAQQRQQFQPRSGGPNAETQQKNQIEAERQQRAYQSLFADNVVRQEHTQAVSWHSGEVPSGEQPSEQAESIKKDSPPASSNEPVNRAPARKPLDFDPKSQPTYYLPEGSIIEAVLTNRLDGEQPGPVNCLITTDVYLPGTRLVVIPQGARALGEASKVSAFGQQRLAVAFHRILIPGLHAYAIPLDKEPPGLAQAGEAGLHDKVNSHYASIFGASLAIGAIGGLAQIGNSASALTYDPSVSFRNGISQSMAQSSERVLDKFLNRLPTITIREGTRVKIVLTSDLLVPAVEQMHERGF
jgi:type IV secretion system protein TrbI